MPSTKVKMANLTRNDIPTPTSPDLCGGLKIWGASTKIQAGMSCALLTATYKGYIIIFKRCSQLVWTFKIEAATKALNILLQYGRRFKKLSSRVIISVGPNDKT